MSKAVLEEVKIALRIDDNAEDKYLALIIDEAKEYFKDTVSTKFSYSKGLERTLLRERVRYVYNNAIEDFEHNFRSELEKLVLKYETNQD